MNTNEIEVLKSLVEKCEQNRVEKTGWSHTYWKLDNFPHSEPIEITWEFIAVVFDDCILIEGLYTFDKNYFINIKAN